MLPVAAPAEICNPLDIVENFRDIVSEIPKTVSTIGLAAICQTPSGKSTADGKRSNQLGHVPMRFDLQKIIESKRALRRDLATRPAAEKLRLLDALRERELVIRANPGCRRSQIGQRTVAQLLQEWLEPLS
jgi:hypothetical protein